MALQSGSSPLSSERDREPCVPQNPADHSLSTQPRSPRSFGRALGAAAAGHPTVGSSPLSYLVVARPSPCHLG